ncbi:biotin/lipoyl-binding protein, partial [Patescibacteria group bacterium]|nr:biotin/lipoyl-binding protein [Patescibacteria group bacterium]
MINFNRKTIFIIIIVFLIIGFVVWQSFFKKEKPEFSLAKVSRGDIIQEVSETGKVKQGEEINLNFKSSGKIEKIYVEVGDNVTTGQDLAKLDNSQLFIQLTEAQAALEVVKAKKADAQVSLENAKQDLNNIKDKEEEDLNNAYEDALIVLDDVYLKIYNTFNVVYNVQKTYFYIRIGYGLKVIEEKYRIEISLKKVESLVSDVKSNPQHGNIDAALSETKAALEKVSNALKRIRDITENAVYREVVSSTDKSYLDTQKVNINSVLDDIINSQQNISTIKINNRTNIDAAEAEVFTLEAQLQSDEG